MTRKPAAVRGEEEEEGEDEEEKEEGVVVVRRPTHKSAVAAAVAAAAEGGEKKEPDCVITNKVKGSTVRERPLEQGDRGLEVLGGSGKSRRV